MTTEAIRPCIIHMRSGVSFPTRWSVESFKATCVKNGSPRSFVAFTDETNKVILMVCNNDITAVEFNS